MNTNNMEKLSVYKRGTIWLRIYMFGYLYGFLVVYSFVMLGSLVSQETWLAILHTWTGQEVTYAGIYSIASVLLIASALVDAVLLPMLNKWAYIATIVHLALLLTHRPLIWLCTRLLVGPLPDSFGSYTRLLFPITLVFVAANLWYFIRRRDLFRKDIVNLVTGMEKDEIKSEFR